MKTANGIELNLQESEYKFVFYDYVFYFSSEFYLNKFKNEVHQFILLETIKIENKYKIKIDLTLYLAVSFYRKIEKRGFRVEHKTGGFIITETNKFRF